MIPDVRLAGATQPKQAALSLPGLDDPSQYVCIRAVPIVDTHPEEAAIDSSGKRVVLRRAVDYQRLGLLARNGNSVDVLRVLGELLSQKGLVSRALQLDERLVACLPSDFLARYNLACSLALAGRSAEAIDSLAEAIRLGYDDMAHMKVDPDLASLRGRPEFRALFGRV